MADPTLLSALTWRGVIFSCIVLLGQIVAGAYNTFNLTLVAIKEKFNYTQTQAEVVMSSFNLGYSMGMPTGFILDRYGPKMTAGVGLMMSVPGLGFMCLATLGSDFLHGKTWLLTVIAFPAGVGFIVVFIVSWTTAARRADPRIRGLTFGVLKSAVLGSPAIFTYLYESFFKNGHEEDVSNQDVSGYFLFLLIIISAMDIVMLFFVTDVSLPLESETIVVAAGNCKIDQKLSEIDASDTLSLEPQKRNPEDKQTSNSGNINHNAGSDVNSSPVSSDRGVSNDEGAPLVPNPSEVRDHIPLVSLMLSPTFNCVTWSTALALSSDTVVYGNIGVITQTLRLQTYNADLMIMSRIITCSATFISGVFLNYVHSRLLRCIMFTTATSLVLTSNIILSCTKGNINILFLGLAVGATGTGMLWVIGATLIFTFCGSRDYGRNWGLVIMIVFVLALVISLIIGKMYDSKVKDVGSTPCVGSHCTLDWFLLLTGVSATAVIISGVFLCLIYRGTVASPVS